jgi:G3E family GTPase
MMPTPFDKASSSIPVTVVTTADGLRFAESGAATIRLEPALHEHEPGNECIACAARGDVRALLFDLLQRSRAPDENPVLSVIVDATRLADPKPVIDRLERGVVPAFGLRDHTVARSFHLSRVI